MAEKLAGDKHAGTTHVTIPIHGPEVTPDTVMEFLKDHMKDATSTIFHLDIAPTVSYSQSTIHILSVPLNSGYLLYKDTPTPTVLTFTKHKQCLDSRQPGTLYNRHSHLKTFNKQSLIFSPRFFAIGVSNLTFD